MKKISIIIPVYNVEKYLEQCLSSVIDQSLKDIEIICVNDGSTDSSVEILNKFSQNDPRIKILHKEHTNAGDARNSGLDIAEGEYILFLDADDYLKENALELLYTSALNNNLDIIMGNVEILNAATGNIESAKWAKNRYEYNKVFSAKKYKNDLYQRCIIWVWNKLYKRTFVKQNNLRFQSIRHQNDVVFHQLALVLAKRIMALENVIITHRYNNINSLEGSRANSPYLYTEAVDLLYKNLQYYKLNRTYYKTFFNSMLSLSIWTILSLELKNTNFDIYKKIITRYFAKYNVLRNIALMNKSNFKDFIPIILDYYVMQFKRYLYKEK